MLRAFGLEGPTHEIEPSGDVGSCYAIYSTNLTLNFGRRKVSRLISKLVASPRELDVLELEERILYSAVPMADAADAPADVDAAVDHESIERLFSQLDAEQRLMNRQSAIRNRT